MHKNSTARRLQKSTTSPGSALVAARTSFVVFAHHAPTLRFARARRTFTVRRRRPNQSGEMDARSFATMDRIHATFDVTATRAVADFVKRSAVVSRSKGDGTSLYKVGDENGYTS